jgi:hypothetical protein
MIPPGGSFCLEGGHPIAQDGLGMDPYGQPYPPPGPPPMDPFPQPAYPPGPGPVGPGPGPVAPVVAQPNDAGGRRTLAGFLVSYQDDSFGRFWPLWQGKNTVGRADTGAKQDIEIAHNTTSTKHAIIECDPQHFVLEDKGSTNGTFHNEEPVGYGGKRELRDGDKLRFGGYSVMVVNVVART